MEMGHIHPIARDIDPFGFDPYLRGQLGGGIESIRQDTIRGSRLVFAIGLPFDRRSMRLNSLDNLRKQGNRRRPNEDSRARDLIPSGTDVHVLEIEGPPRRQNVIQTLARISESMMWPCKTTVS